jgi:hypothetical protein
MKHLQDQVSFRSGAEGLDFFIDEILRIFCLSNNLFLGVSIKQWLACEQKVKYCS